MIVITGKQINRKALHGFELTCECKFHGDKVLCDLLKEKLNENFDEV